ncbi:MAG: hypothetical protein ACLR23_22905 [Clostridia bacterium]
MDEFDLPLRGDDYRQSPCARLLKEAAEAGNSLTEQEASTACGLFS